jgi:hypothetical protein
MRHLSIQGKLTAIFCMVILWQPVPSVCAREHVFSADDSTAIKRSFQQRMQQLQLTGYTESIRMSVLSLPSVYHWYVSVEGSDSNPGTETAPFRTIQYAINRSTSGQGIKVGEGRYTECLDFNGKSVQVVGNPHDPASTIIDAGGRGRVIMMTRRETASTLLCGFTLTGGSALSTVYPDHHGAGIYLFDNANPVLSDLIITGNTASSVSAIAALHSSAPTVRNVLIYGNTSFGGLDVRIHNNISNARFHNVTLSDGLGSERASILVSSNSTLEVKNSILYNSSYANELEVSASILNVSYTNIKGGSGSIFRHSGTINTGAGIINAVPGFVDPPSGKYQLTASSPCIDMGDPAAGWNDRNIPPARGTVRNDLGAYGGQVTAQPYQETLPATRKVRFSYDPSGNMDSRRKILVSQAQSFSRLKSGNLPDNQWDDTDWDTPVPTPVEEQLQENKVTIYPNPTRGDLRVDITGNIPSGSMIYLYNSSGSPVRHWTNLSGSNQLDIPELPAGTYLMRLILGKEAGVWKIIKQ